MLPLNPDVEKPALLKSMASITHAESEFVMVKVVVSLGFMLFLTTGEILPVVSQVPEASIIILPVTVYVGATFSKTTHMYQALSLLELLFILKVTADAGFDMETWFQLPMLPVPLLVLM